jgi:hypothetical protein
MTSDEFLRKIDPPPLVTFRHKSLSPSKKTSQIYDAPPFQVKPQVNELPIQSTRSCHCLKPKHLAVRAIFVS